MAETEGLSLSNVCEGKLEREFMTTYPKILKQLKDGQKATITIDIVVERPKDSSMLACVKANFKTKMPPSDARISLYPFNAEFGIKTEKLETTSEDNEQGVIQFPNALGQR